MANISGLDDPKTGALSRLPAGWTCCRLEEILEPNGLSYGIVQPGSDDPDGVPILRVKNIRNGTVHTNDVLRVSKGVEGKYQRTRLRGGEVLLTLVGSVGEIAVAPPSLSGWNVARAIAVIRVTGEVSVSWIRTCLSSELAQHSMNMWQTTTVQATLNLRDVRKLPIIMPPKAERDAITATLGALDDKIAIDDMIAKSTRDLSRTIFRTTVQAHDADDIDLSSVAKFLSRGIAPNYTKDVSQLRVLNQKCIRNGRVTLKQSRRTLLDRIPAPKLLRVHDVLVNSTGVGTLGRVALWTGDQPCTVDSHVTIVRFDPAKVDPLCAGIGMLDAEAEIETLGEGSTGQTELSRAQLAAFRLVLPSQNRAAQLRPKLQALERRGEAALAESQTLAELRDALLPRLMSGEIRVRDAEKIVEDAT